MFFFIALRIIFSFFVCCFVFFLFLFLIYESGIYSFPLLADPFIVPCDGYFGVKYYIADLSCPVAPSLLHVDIRE